PFCLIVEASTPYVAGATYKRHNGTVTKWLRCVYGFVDGTINDAELAQEASVVGSDVLLDQPTLVVEPEDVHQIHDEALARGLDRPDRRLRERAYERALDPGLAGDVVTLCDDDAAPDPAVVEGGPQRLEARQRRRPRPNPSGSMICPLNEGR